MHLVPLVAWPAGIPLASWCDTPMGVKALLMIAVLESIALAGPRPAAGASADYDPNDAVRASASGPWLDLGPSAALDTHVGSDHTPKPDHRLRSALQLGGFYAGFGVWAYFAWYRNHLPHDFRAGGDHLFGVKTYAGGADKLGHAWATMALARLGSAVLSEGGWNRTGATLVSAALSELLFLNVEIRDGFYFEFSYGDLAMNTVGMAAAIALDLWPRLDELIDFRVQYFPSARYIENLDGAPNADGSPSCPKGVCSRWNIAEDYSGQTFLLAFHLGGIHALRDWKYGTWSRFLDVALGFETRNYKPPPDPSNRPRAHQELFVGLSLNAQGLFDYLLGNGRHETLRKVTHGLFEVFNLPYTSTGLGWTRTADGKPVSGGA